jgi:hypothetical protein
MTEKKTIKRAVKAVWSDVKALRAGHGKSYAASDIAAAGDELAQHAAKLTALAKEMSALSAMPAGDATPRPARKRKAGKKVKPPEGDPGGK